MWWMCMVSSAQNSMGVIHDVQLLGHRNLSAMYWNANIDFTPLLGKVLLRVPIALGKLSLLHLCTKTYTTHFPSWNQLKLRAVSLGRKSHCISPNPMSVRFLLPKVVYSTGDADLSLLHTVGLVCLGSCNITCEVLVKPSSDAHTDKKTQVTFHLMASF